MTKPFIRRIRSAELALVGTLLGVTASAETPAAPPPAARVSLQHLGELQREVARARASDPRTFIAVSSIVARAPDAALRARGRKAPTAREIARLGKSAVLPALEMLAIDPPHGLPAAAQADVRRDLVEAIGLLGDDRGLPVLASILEGDREDHETMRTAAEAIARIGTEEAADELVSALRRATGERARAVVAGMGECRRLRVTEAIAERLRSATDEATARVAARALGRAGNAWAWQTRSDHAEEQAIRAIAARALVDAFVQQRGEARDAASNALVVVDAPETPGLIAAARAGASPETAEALDRLATRVARSPARAR